MNRSYVANEAVSVTEDRRVRDELVLRAAGRGQRGKLTLNRLQRDLVSRLARLGQGLTWGKNNNVYNTCKGLIYNTCKGLRQTWSIDSLGLASVSPGERTITVVTPV